MAIDLMGAIAPVFVRTKLSLMEVLQISLSILGYVIFITLGCLALIYITPRK